MVKTLAVIVKDCPMTFLKTLPSSVELLVTTAMVVSMYRYRFCYHGNQQDIGWVEILKPMTMSLMPSSQPVDMEIKTHMMYLIVERLTSYMYILIQTQRCIFVVIFLPGRRDLLRHKQMYGYSVQ